MSVQNSPSMTETHKDKQSEIPATAARLASQSLCQIIVNGLAIALLKYQGGFKRC